MPTSLTIDQHLAVLASAGADLLDLALGAGFEAAVPTCRAWDVRALVAHQAMVHRWAAAHVRGSDPAAVANQTKIRTTVGDLPAFYREGLADLLDALATAPPDLHAMTFLADAPPPRAFWARRQTHETTIHGVDALAAQLGRLPLATETGIERPLAVDGLDELLRGFFSRGRSRLYDGHAHTIAVVPTDAAHGWLLHVADRMTVDDLDMGAGDLDTGHLEERAAAATLTGTTVQLYLGLWNRGDEVELSGRPDVLERWRSTQRVRWS
jgi:uncharacterized protein (TIGR03083 family)